MEVIKMTKKIKVFGPPGTGKTKTIMGEEYGYKHLLQHGYTTDDITVVTYRKDAAQELRNQINSITKLEEKYLKPHVGTIHSICLRLIGNPRVCVDKDKRKFVKEYGYESYTKINKSKKDEDDFDIEDDTFTGDLFDIYNWCRSTCTLFEDWEIYPGRSMIDLSYNEVFKFFHDYEKFKKQNIIVDYSDMLQEIIDRKIIIDTPALILDEFQDLTRQMYRIFEMWATWCDYVIIAGDPNQSIYGYAGGSPKFFINYYADEIKLNQTYRLPDQINLLSRKVLEIESIIPPDTFGKIGYNDVIRYIDYDEETPVYNSELHLFRCKYQIPPAALQLAEQGKVFSTPSPYPGWTRKEIDLANAIITYRNGKLLNREQVMALIDNYSAKDLEMSVYAKTDKECKKVFIDKYMPLGVEPTRQVQKRILNKALINSLWSDDPTKDMIIGNGSNLFTSKICGILERKDLIAREEVKNRRLMTIHAAKGLEADVVFLHIGITKLVEASVYGELAQSQEEARVWYVGTSRAREILYIVEDKGRKYELPDAFDIPNRNEVPNIKALEYIETPKLLIADW